MTCLIDDPLAPRAHVVDVVVVVFAVRADATWLAGEAPAGSASRPRPRARAPPAATVNVLAGRWLCREAVVLRGARVASPFISLLAPMGGYLHQHRNTTVSRPLAAVGSALSMGAMRAKHWPGTRRQTR